jgi:hypothetical protein
MAPPTGAFVMRNSLVTIDTVEYANQSSTARLTPEAETATWKGLVPDAIVQDVDSAVWTFNLSAIQDYTTAVGLARYLTVNHGQQIDVTLEPKAGGVSAAFTAIAVATEFGGEQGSFATIEVELPVIGQPVFTDPI